MGAHLLASPPLVVLGAVLVAQLADGRHRLPHQHLAVAQLLQPSPRAATVANPIPLALVVTTGSRRPSPSAGLHLS